MVLLSTSYQWQTTSKPCCWNRNHITEPYNVFFFLSAVLNLALTAVRKSGITSPCRRPSSRRWWQGRGRAASAQRFPPLATGRVAAAVAAMAASAARSRRIFLNHLDSYCGRSIGEVGERARGGQCSGDPEGGWRQTCVLYVSVFIQLCCRSVARKCGRRGGGKWESLGGWSFQEAKGGTLPNSGDSL